MVGRSAITSVLPVIILVAASSCNVERTGSPLKRIEDKTPCFSADSHINPGPGDHFTFTGRAAAVVCIAATRDAAEYLVTMTLAPSHKVPVSYQLKLESSPAMLQGATSAKDTQADDPVAQFEHALRLRASTALRFRVPSARATAQSSPGVRFGRQDAHAGQLESLNVALNSCDSVSQRTGRIVAFSRRAVIIADTSNPQDGFSDEQYLAFAEAFDSLIYSADTQAFGEPTDIDANGRVKILFTRAVNALTPANASYVIGGFFHPRDLFPKTVSGFLTGCTGSNTAEMFYVLVPDPRGIINGNVRSVESARRSGMAVLAHELEHLINSSRRLYVNVKADWPEDVWLDEGLAHVAEELVFFAASGLTPRTDIDVSLLQSDPAVLTAANLFQAANFRRFAMYLQVPGRYSPLPANRADDRVQTRGASWSFLRYLVDHSGMPEQGIWRGLIDSPVTGVANLSVVFPGIDERLREWAIANFLDGAGSPTRFNHPSWNLPGILRELGGGNPPIATPIPFIGADPVTLVAGGAAYYRFAVGSGQGSALRLGSGNEAMPPELALTVVRIR